MPVPLHVAALGRPKKFDDARQVAVRLPVAVIAEIDEEAKRMALPGMKLDRSDAIRVLVMEALAERAKHRK